MLVTIAAMAMAAEKKETKVEVGGATYRVLQRGPEVVVSAKAFMTRRSPQARDAMREAVLKATSCQLTDDYWEGSRLVGKLQCPTPATPAAD